MINKTLKIIATFNLLLSAIIALSYALLLAFQKNCEFCSTLIGPLTLFSVFTLIAYLSLKTLEKVNIKLAQILLSLNILGIISSIYYLAVTYLF